MQSTEVGLMLRRAIDLRAALNLGVGISLHEVRADEFAAMLILEEERDLLSGLENSHTT